MTEKKSEPEPTERKQQEPPKTPPFPVRTPDELRALGIPVTKDLIISPVPGAFGPPRKR